MCQKINVATIRKNQPIKKMLVMISTIFIGLFIINNVYAKDLLQNTTGDAMDTLNGEGKKWAYLIDFALASGAYMVTKKPMVFFSVAGLAVAFTVITKMVSA